MTRKKRIIKLAIPSGDRLRDDVLALFREAGIALLQRGRSYALGVSPGLANAGGAELEIEANLVKPVNIAKFLSAEGVQIGFTGSDLVDMMDLPDDQRPLKVMDLGLGKARISLCSKSKASWENKLKNAVTRCVQIQFQLVRGHCLSRFQMGRLRRNGRGAWGNLR